MLIFLFVYLCISLRSALGDEQFFVSARSGDLDTLNKYLLKGFPVNSRDSKGNTAIIIAAGRGQVGVIKLLLEHGAQAEDVTMQGLFEGKSALCWASSQGRTGAVAILLEAGADPNRAADRGVFEGKTALMWASSQGRAEVVSLLLSAEVDPDYSPAEGNFKGKSALMWASSQGRLSAVMTLLEAGVNVNAVDGDGISALMWASGSEVSDEGHKKGLLEKANKGHVEVVESLLRYGAEIDASDKDGITAIMYASYNGHAGAVEALMNWGADCDIANTQGRTALQLAKNAGYTDVVELIRLGPSIMKLPVPVVFMVPTCGWVLNVLRSPWGKYRIIRPKFSPPPLSCTAVNGSSTLCKAKTELESNQNELYRVYRNSFSVAETCASLRTAGLDHMLGDVLELFAPSNCGSVTSFYPENVDGSGCSDSKVASFDSSSYDSSETLGPGCETKTNNSTATLGSDGMKPFTSESKIDTRKGIFSTESEVLRLEETLFSALPFSASATKVRATGQWRALVHKYCQYQQQQQQKQKR